MKQFLMGFLLLNVSLCHADVETKVPHTVKSGEQYYFALPAKQIAYGALNMVSTSEDGRFISYILDTQLNHDPNRLIELSNFNYSAGSSPGRGVYVYDRANGQSQMILAMSNPDLVLDKMYWLPGTSFLTLAQHSSQAVNTSVYNPFSRRFVSIQSSVTNAYQNFYAVPQQNCYILISHLYLESGQTNYVEVFDSEFRLLRTHKLPANAPLRLQVIKGLLVATRYNRPSNSWEAFSINLNTAELSPIPVPEEETFPLTGLQIFNSKPDTLAIADAEVIINANIQSRMGATEAPQANIQSEANPRPRDPAKVKAAFEELNARSLILTTEGTYGQVIGKNEAVWHANRSGLFVTDLLPLSASQYEELLINRVKQETMSRAKQVGTAMMIYCADYDDMLPPAKGWEAGIDPYMRNQSIRDGFVYMLDGENAGEIDDPSNKVLGFIETQYGTAYVRVDGSVIWKDRPKPIANLPSLENLKN